MDARVMVQRFLLKFAHVCVREIVLVWLSAVWMRDPLNNQHIYQVKIWFLPNFAWKSKGHVEEHCHSVTQSPISQGVYKEDRKFCIDLAFTLHCISTHRQFLQLKCPWIGFELSHCCHKSKEQSFSECKCVRSILTC